MGLTEILCILILAGIVAVAVLLVMLLRRSRDAAPSGVTPEEVQAMLEQARQATVNDLLKSQDRSQAAMKNDLLGEIRASRTETVQTVQTSMDRLGRTLRENQTAANEAQKQLMTAMAGAQDKRLETVEKQLESFGAQNRASLTEMRRTTEDRLSAMQTQNAEQLEKMRATVDEKLQKTLDERISQSFQAVNDRLAEVYRGLGEMKTLAGNVGDLKKVLSGVKTRGILGEIQLGTIIEDMLAPEQYEKNVVTVPGTRNPVEYAICLPGDGEGKVYLPVDAKFPGDTYQHLLDAYDACDAEAVKEAQSALSAMLRREAKDIHDKYIAPPYTTNFGIMFLPAEGLYAEVVRMGLSEALRQEYQITISGPTTLAALLNSLQMGFRTLAIQKRSDEVWRVLGAVKTEFSNFDRVLQSAQQRIEQTHNELEKLVGVRTRQINRKLKSVSELPSDESVLLIGGEDGDKEDN